MSNTQPYLTAALYKFVDLPDFIEPKAHMAERQRQVELADARGVAHVGAKMRAV